MKLLYADDDSDDREIFCDAIRQIDPAIQVVLSKDGQEALEILNAVELLPDFIFLDINMPRMNGIECHGKVKIRRTFEKHSHRYLFNDKQWQ